MTSNTPAAATSKSLTLTRRLTIALIGMSLLSFALHLAVVHSLMYFVGGELATGLARTAQLEKNLIASAPAPQRAALAAQLSGERHVVAKTTDLHAIQGGVPESNLISNQIATQLREQLGPGMRADMLTLSDGQTSVLIRFMVEAQEYAVLHTPRRPYAVAWASALAWLSLLGIALAAGTALFARWIARPLMQVEQQIGQQGRPGQQLAPLLAPPRAGREIENLVRAFNQLVATNQRAEANKLQMLAGVSHDLRTPLARLRFRVELACEEPVASEFTRDLTELERIVSQFVSYAQGNSHVGFGQTWPIDEVAARVADGYMRHDKPVHHTGSAEGFAKPDLAIQRALTNLIDNALAHGKGPIHVQTERAVDDSGEQVRLTVWDCGAGLSAAEFEVARQPFSRLQSPHNEGAHSGLGLAIVDQIAQLTGAKLEALHRGGRFGIALVWPVNAV